MTANALPSVVRVKRVTVTVELEDGHTRVIESRPGAIRQDDGVRINEDARPVSDSISTGMADWVKTTTVAWSELWTEMTR